MIIKPSFFGVIIGTEILTGRREDAHFKFLRDELQKRGWKLSGIYIISDNEQDIKDNFHFLKNKVDSVFFSFGGIGSTPDDLTRNIAGDVFRNGEMQFNDIFRQKIYARFGIDGSNHRVNMSYLPKDSELLFNNPINGMCGFSIDSRFFFVPGFPEMSHPMIIEALDKYYPINNIKRYSKSLTLNFSENSFIDWMNNLPKDIELSSLPKYIIAEDGSLKPTVELRIEGYNEEILDIEIKKLLNIVASF
jgi:molybdopterin-biosynthesis enzyme MoeA-like protein